LFDNDKEYRTVNVGGLVQVQPDIFGHGWSAFVSSPARVDLNFPVAHANSSNPSIGGCPFALGALRTYFLNEGDYIVETHTGIYTAGCAPFNLKMRCSGGAESVSPEESDPLGFSVNKDTGAITGTPERVRDGYKMRLRAVDAIGTRSDVVDWTFNVEEPPTFALNEASGWSMETDGKLNSKYHIDETHLLSKPRLASKDLLQHPANDAFDDIVYLLSATPDESNAVCNTADDNENQVFSDVTSGSGALNIKCEGNYTAKLVVRDGAGANVEVRSWQFEVLPRDTHVPAYGPNNIDCVHGTAMDEVDMDRTFTCDCGETQYTGLNCEVEPVGPEATTTTDNTATTSAYSAIGAVLFLLSLAVAYKVHSGKDRRRRIGLARKAAEPSYGASKAELTDGLLAAVELGEYGLVPALVELGADASARGASGQLPHASALKDHLQLANPVHLAAIKALFGAHCEFDAQIGACMRLDEEELVEHVLCEMVSSSWRSATTADTVAHKILEGCITGSLKEDQTVELMEAVLKRDKDVMTAPNARSKTPTELAIMCEGKLEIQTRFTVVLFERYQIARPQNPLYKSPTAEVHECVDLAELNNSEHAIGSNKRFVVKLMSNPDLWLRELKTRDALGEAVAGSYVGAISAASTEIDTATMTPAAAAAAQAAAQYASSASTDVRPINVFQTAAVNQTRRDEARHLMTEYPYAIQMPLADRNLNEIIASERLAEEPLDVIRQSSRKVLNLIQDLHSEGVVHGDVKPKNVVRVERTLMLIDLDMSVTIGSSEPVAHSNPEKFSGSTAYAAPELHKWMAEREASGFVEDGTSPLDKLTTPQQIDLWSFAVTMYEMASGSPLFQNSYDRATPAALAKLKNWTGLDEEHVSQIESLHGATDSAALRDVLLWALDANASSRPQSVAELCTHAFFDPRKGGMREHFVVNQIKQLLAAAPTNGSQRVDVNVMISYSWADTNFVLSRLIMELAPRVRELWLDRLGGEQGMGEFAKASMQRGVQNADVIIAVVSPAYINSVNCGYEMEVAHAMGKPVIPVVLNVPFNEWPPKQIGQSPMINQFATDAGDVKIFVDMTDQASFFQKFQNELLPRLNGGPGGFQSTAVMPTPVQPVTDEVDDVMKAALASDSAAVADAAANGSSTNRIRPKKGQNKVAPAPPVADDVRGECGRCGQPVLGSQHRTVQKGVYFHDACPE
jgi:serine/threonine protein kinase